MPKSLYALKFNPATDQFPVTLLPLTMQDAHVVFSKFFMSDLMVTNIYFNVRISLCLADCLPSHAQVQRITLRHTD